MRDQLVNRVGLSDLEDLLQQGLVFRNFLPQFFFSLLLGIFPLEVLFPLACEFLPHHVELFEILFFLHVRIFHFKIF